MSELRYCLKCGEACEIIWLRTGETIGGIFYNEVTYKGLASCVNSDCEWWGLAAFKSHTTKPIKAKSG